MSDIINTYRSNRMNWLAIARSRAMDEDRIGVMAAVDRAKISHRAVLSLTRGS